MPLRPVPPGSLPRETQSSDPQAAARRIWAAWTRGVSPCTLVSRRSDLALFGDFTWRARDVFAVIRRVIATLERGAEAFRMLALAWSDAQLERGAAFHTRSRQWSTLAQLVAFIGKQIPRRGSPAPSIGRMRRELAGELDGAAAQRIIARAVAAGADDDAVIVALAMTRTPEEIAALTIGDLRKLEATDDTIGGAIARVCGAKHGNAHAFPGRTLGRALTARGVTMRCERNGTTAAALRRLGAT